MEGLKNTTPNAEAEVTEADLLKLISKAGEEQNWSLMTQLARKLATLTSGKAEAERKEREEALAGITIKVQKAIDKAIEPLLPEIEKLKGEGIWFAYEFGELNDKRTRLLKSTVASTTKKGSGGGGGKKSPVSTDDYLKEYGEQVMDKESGETYNQYYQRETGSNQRFKVRQHMMKIDQDNDNKVLKAHTS